MYAVVKGIFAMVETVIKMTKYYGLKRRYIIKGLREDLTEGSFEIQLRLRAVLAVSFSTF